MNNDGGPAFPIEGWQELIIPPDRRGVPFGIGMSLRDYFAGNAMISLIALGDKLEDKDLGPDAKASTVVASQAYEIADEMLKARSNDDANPNP